MKERISDLYPAELANLIESVPAPHRENVWKPAHEESVGEALAGTSALGAGSTGPGSLP